MDKKNLMLLGDASVLNALANMFAIVNGDGEILSKIGDGESMGFSPRLECDKDCSVVLFDDEDGARSMIDDVLLPQEDGCEYCVFKFSPNEDMETDIFDDGFELEDDDVNVDVTDNVGDDGGVEDDVNGNIDTDQLPEDMTLDDAIKHAREVGEKMLSEDPECGCGKEHIKLANWLEELKQLKEGNVKDTSDVENKEDEEDDAEESDVPSLKDMKRILKRNGYQLVLHKGDKEKWKKEDGGKAITLPKDGEIDAEKWLKIVDSNGLKTDI